MLDYLLDLITKYISIVFICVLILCMASTYSKKIKVLFITILVLFASYFALLCLYKLGVGIQPLYEWSCDIVYFLCSYIERFNIIIFNNEFILSRLIYMILNHHTMALIQMISVTAMAITFIGIFITHYSCNIRLKKPPL